MRPSGDAAPDGTSSAVPEDLHAYSRAALEIDEQIHQLALRLGRVLDAYRATNPEFGDPIHRIEDDLARYARFCREVDLRVGRIADAFEHAGAASPADAAGQPVVVADAVLAQAMATPPKAKSTEHHEEGGGLFGGLLHAVEHTMDSMGGAASAAEHAASDALGTVEHAGSAALHDVEDAGAALVHGLEHPSEDLVAAAAALEQGAGGVKDFAAYVVEQATMAEERRLDLVGDIVNAAEHPEATATALDSGAGHLEIRALQGLDALGGRMLHNIEHPVDGLKDAEQAATDFVSGFAAGVRDMAQAAILLARVIPGTPLWAASMAIDPEGTMRLQEQFARGLVHMAADPGDAVANMLDVKDLEGGNFAKWAGHLTPDVIVTLLTAGAGGAAAATGESVATTAAEATAEDVAATAAEGAATSAAGAAKAAADAIGAEVAAGPSAAAASADEAEALAATRSAGEGEAPTAGWSVPEAEAPLSLRPTDEPPRPRLSDPSGERGRPQMRDFEDPAFVERTEMIRRYTEEHGGPGGPMATHNLFRSEEGAYYADRYEQQQQIVDDLLQKAEAAGVAHEQKALMLGGMGGAGKSAALKSAEVTELGIDESRYLTINPDEIKEIMAERGMIPQYDGLTPMEASTFVHEESSEISLRLAREAIARDMNIAWDMTMHSDASALTRLAMTPGYSTTGIFVDVPVEQSWVSAYARYMRGANLYRDGEGSGGRFVPRELIEGQTDPTGEFLSKNRAAFEAVKDRGVFERWFRFDNSAARVDQRTGAIEWQQIRLRESGEAVP